MGLRLPFGSQLVVLTVDRLGTTNYTFAAWGRAVHGKPWVLDRIWLSTTAYGRLETVVAVPEGILDGCAVQHLDTLEVLGDAWVSVTLRVVGPGFAEDAAVIASGYCTQFNSIGYPAGGRPNSGLLKPVTTVVVVANPAAGAEIVFPVPAGHRMTVYAVAARFVASAVAATRRPQIVLDDGATQLVGVASAGTITAGQTRDLTFSNQGSTSFSGTTFIATILPLVTLLGGHRVRTVMDLIDVGDQYSNVRLTVGFAPLFAP